MELVLLLKGACALILFVQSVSPASAQETQVHAWEIGRASILCIEDQSTGFDWRKGQWVRVRFLPGKYVVRKIDVGELAPSMCGMESPPGEDLITDGFAALSRCYNVRKFGDEYSAVHSQVCTEFYKGPRGTQKFKLTSISCSSMKFLPDGWFHHVTMHSDVSANPKGDYKDSLSVSVGRCSSG